MCVWRWCRARKVFDFSKAYTCVNLREFKVCLFAPLCVWVEKKVYGRGHYSDWRCSYVCAPIACMCVWGVTTRRPISLYYSQQGTRCGPLMNFRDIAPSWFGSCEIDLTHLILCVHRKIQSTLRRQSLKLAIIIPVKNRDDGHMNPSPAALDSHPFSSCSLNVSNYLMWFKG